MICPSGWIATLPATPSAVVPAKAGTHHHREVLLRKPTTIAASQFPPRRMGPGFRRDDIELGLLFCLGKAVVQCLAGKADRHSTTSSVHTLKLTRVFGPKVWVIGTSEASRPCPISTRPIRGTLFLGSKVCQRPPI
jgi:hypothetical protein